MQLTIKPIDGSGSFSIESEPSDTTEFLKSKIQGHIGVAPAQQRLINSRGQEMQNGLTLSDYNIQANMQITLVIRLQGA